MSSVNSKKGTQDSEDIFGEALVQEMPEDLWESVQNMRLDEDYPDDVVKAEKIASELYEKWRDNSFSEVDLTLFYSAVADGNTRCSEARLESDVDFDADYPEAEDYADGKEDLDYKIDYADTDIKVARAQMICADCPLKTACLMQSLNITVPTRGKYRGKLYFNYDRHGVWGGYGPSSREMIFANMFQMWDDDPAAPIDPASREEFAQNQQREREQAMIRSRNERRKKNILATQSA